jgi:hypothetical protein
MPSEFFLGLFLENGISLQKSIFSA